MKKNKKIYKLVVVAFLLLFVTGCEEQSFDFQTMCVKCNETYFPLALATLSRNVIDMIQVLTPSIIIIIGMIELVKAVMAGDEKKMDEVKPSLIKKIIAGVMIFLVIAIVKFAFGTVNDKYTDSALECMSIFISESSNETPCPARTDGTAVSTKNNNEEEYSGHKTGESSYTEQKDEEYQENSQNCVDRNKTNCTRGLNCKWGYANGGSVMSCYYNDPTEASSGCYRCTSGGSVHYEWAKYGGTGCYKTDSISGKGVCTSACTSLDPTNCGKRDDCEMKYVGSVLSCAKK